MSFQPTFPGLFSPSQGATPVQPNAVQAAAPLPATQKQLAYAKTSKQVGFAERIARLKRSEVPPECFRDRTLMSRWIDSNKPR